MISSLVELEEATAFERWALEELVPLPSSRPHTAVKDMEKNEVRVMGASAVVRVYAGGAREVYVDLRLLPSAQPGRCSTSSWSSHFLRQAWAREDV